MVREFFLSYFCPKSVCLFQFRRHARRKGYSTANRAHLLQGGRNRNWCSEAGFWVVSKNTQRVAHAINRGQEAKLLPLSGQGHHAETVFSSCLNQHSSLRTQMGWRPTTAGHCSRCRGLVPLIITGCGGGGWKKVLDKVLDQVLDVGRVFLVFDHTGKRNPPL